MNLHAFSTWLAMISQMAAAQTPGERIDGEPTVTADPAPKRRFVPVEGNPLLDYDTKRGAFVVKPLP